MVGEFPGVSVSTGHYEVDWPAALGGDLLHIGKGVKLVSRRTQPADFRAHTGIQIFDEKQVNKRLSAKSLERETSPTVGSREGTRRHRSNST